MKRKPKRLLSLALALIFTAAALAGAGGRFYLSPGAEAYDSVIDASGFVDPNDNLTSCYIYKWHKGPPPAGESLQKREQNGQTPPNFTNYPILLTWDKKYYLTIDGSFANTLASRYDNGATDFYRAAGSIAQDLTFKLTMYQKYGQQVFSMGKQGLLANQPVFQELQKNGLAVCMEENIAGLPWMTPANVIESGTRQQYLIGVPEIAGTLLDPVLDARMDQNGELDTVNTVARPEDYYVNWLIPQYHLYGYGEKYAVSTTGLGVMHGSAGTILDKDYSYNAVASKWLLYLSPEIAKARKDPKSKFNRFFYIIINDSKDFKRDSFVWGVVNNSSQNPANVRISSPAQAYELMVEFKGEHSKPDGIFYMVFYHDKSNFIVTTREFVEEWEKKSYLNEFDIYYAEPVIASIMQEPFTVEKGQVVNLDGPIILGQNCVVTVKDGGVLSCAGWIVNNGQILVEPGGTMLVQTLAHETGGDDYGAVTNAGTDPETACGRIACDGKMIVMRDCKVAGAGLYGLQFGAGAQVVNYGQIISENLEIYADHTIENRGDASAVFAGWGLTNLGYELSQEQIVGEAYPGKGIRQKTAAVKAPRQAVYGEGANRFYINTAGSVTTTNVENRKGYVSGFTAPIPESAYIDTGYTIAPLPDSVPVYYDEDYGTYYIEVNGVIYHYTAAYGRWVAVRQNGQLMFYDYGMPAEGRELLPGKLPAGYTFFNGLTVPKEGELPNIAGLTVMDLKYDDRYELIWFRADNGHIYHYEPELADYLYVDDAGYFHRYPELVAPPDMDNGRYYVTADMVARVPAESDARRYAPGMEEYGTEGAAAG